MPGIKNFAQASGARYATIIAKLAAPSTSLFTDKYMAFILSIELNFIINNETVITLSVEDVKQLA